MVVNLIIENFRNVGDPWQDCAGAPLKKCINKVTETQSIQQYGGEASYEGFVLRLFTFKLWTKDSAESVHIFDHTE